MRGKRDMKSAVKIKSLSSGGMDKTDKQKTLVSRAEELINP